MRSGTRGLILLAVAAMVVAPGLAAVGSAAEREVTFTKDVAPILQRSCHVCHRPNNMAPMSLLTYEEVRPWARSIKQRVMAREMPPWHIDKTVGLQKFKNDPSLSDEEMATIVTWVDSGAPRGNPADMPPPRQFPPHGAWRIGGGEPDYVVSSPLHTVPAEGGDWWGDYIVPSGLGPEDRYIKAIQTKAGDLQVTHHVLTYAVTDVDAPEDDNSNDFFLNEYALGKNADVYPEGTGKLLAGDARIRFSFHYHPKGEEVVDQTQLGLVFYPKGYVPKHVLYSRQLGQAGELDIPAGQVTRHDGYTRMNLPGRLTGFQPHMHFEGKRSCVELIYPNNTTEMVSCANFNMAWHIVYNYQDDVQPIYPAGTILHVISYHDNTAGNKGNPDPKNWTGSGSRGVDEMAFAWISWYDLTEEEYKQELEARKAKKTTRNNE